MAAEHTPAGTCGRVAVFPRRSRKLKKGNCPPSRATHFTARFDGSAIAGRSIDRPATAEIPCKRQLFPHHYPSRVFHVRASTFAASQLRWTCPPKLRKERRWKRRINGQAARLISIGKLHNSRCVHIRPIDLVIFQEPLGDLRPGTTHLVEGFTLRCFQRFSLPHVATEHYHWRDNSYTRGASNPVLSY